MNHSTKRGPFSQRYNQKSMVRFVSTQDSDATTQRKQRSPVRRSLSGSILQILIIEILDLIISDPDGVPQSFRARAPALLPLIPDSVPLRFFVLDMDDSLEQPDAAPKQPPVEQRAPEDDEQSSGDEDEGPDWTKLP